MPNPLTHGEIAELVAEIVDETVQKRMKHFYKWFDAWLDEARKAGIHPPTGRYGRHPNKAPRKHSRSR